MPRLFIGIKIENLPNITSLSYSLRKQLAGESIIWVDPANFHLTLKFLGDVEKSYLNSIKLILEQISQTQKSFSLQLNKLGYFGRKSQPTVLWLDFQPCEELIKLQQTVENSLTELGFDREEKKYSPHLTIARIKRIDSIERFNKLMQPETLFSDKVIIDEFQFFESTLKPSGPVYTKIAVFKLQESDSLPFNNNH